MTITKLDTVDPNVAVIDTNVRRNAAADKDLVSSIKQHGILQPPVGWRDQDGIVHITMGQRRTLAARAAGLTEIPVIIQDQAEAETARIVAQLAENDHRDALPDSDRVQAFKQLAFDLGVSAAVISKRTGTPLARVGAALTVAQTPAALDAIEQVPMTLEQAAALAEFADDAEDLQGLMDTLRDDPEYFEHTVQELRDAREEKAAIAAVVAEVEAAGVVVVDSYNYEQHFRTEQLWRVDDDEEKRLTEDEVLALPGVVATVARAWIAGEWGIKASYWITREAAQAAGVTSPTLRARDRIAPAEKTAEQTEAESAERRRRKEVRAAADTATKVRQAWIREHLLGVKIKPTEVFDWLTRCTIGDRRTLRYGAGDKAKILTCTWLGIDGVVVPPNSWDTSNASALLEAHTDAAKSDDERLRIMLALTIAAPELVLTDTKRPDYGEIRESIPYLLQLQAWGYTLSDVERALTEAA